MPTGLFVTHPLTGEKIEVWVGNYVLMAYGDGAVMGVPAHDERDFAFAKKYGLAHQAGHRHRRRDVLDRRVAAVVRGQDARPLRQLRQVRRPRLRSRRRRHCRRSRREGPGREEDHVPAARLGRLAPAVLGHADPDRPLSRRAATCRFRRRTCPSCCRRTACPTAPAIRSRSARISSTRRARSAEVPRSARPTRSTRSSTRRGTTCATRAPDAPTMVDARNDYWNPMDQYIGGIEHAILHLLYARFWTKVMRDMGLVKFDEPFTRLMTQGMLLNHIFFRRTAKGGIDYCAPADVDVTHDAEGRVTGARLKADGQPVEYGGVGTMSKSKLNGVDPQEHDRAIRRRHRAPVRDVRRLAAGQRGVVGCRRRRRAPLPAPAVDVRADARRHRDAARRRRVDGSDSAAAPVQAARREIHLTLKQANYDYERIQYNTVVSAGMKLLNTLEAVADRRPRPATRCCARALSILLRVLYPVVPHTRLGDLGRPRLRGRVRRSLLDAPWPQVDPAALVQDEIELVLQINGKLRGKLVRPGDRRPRRHRVGGARERGCREARRRRAGEESHRRPGHGSSMSWSSAIAHIACAGARRRVRRRGLRLPSARRCAAHFPTLFISAPGNAPIADRAEARDRRQRRHELVDKPTDAR